MKEKYIPINDIVHTISKTHSFNTEKLYAINTSDVLEGEILSAPLMNISELKGQFKKTIQKGDLLFSEIRPANRRYAKVLIDDTKNYVVSTKLMVLRKYNDDVDFDYFYYCITNQWFLNILQQRAENRICSFPQITFDLLKEYKFRIPQLDEQKRIAKILSFIDNKIKLNNRMNAELEAMAKQLYDYWFVQFDFPDENGNPCKSSGGKMVYNSTLKREIPEGWEVKSINELTRTPKKSINPYEKPDKEYKHYSIPAYDACGSYLIEKGEAIQSNKFLVCDGQILAPKLNPWYNRIVLVNSGEDSICSTEYVILEAIEDYLKGFLFYVVKTDRFISYCTKGSTGTSHSQRRVPPEILKGFVVPYNSSIVSKFTNCIMPQIDALNNNLDQIRKLTHLRDSLLPMLMNGQVTVE